MRFSSTTMLVGAILVSILVMLGFGGVSTALFLRVLPPEYKEVLIFVAGAWSSLATAVVGFWIGSSVSSMHKTALLDKP